MDPTSTFLIVFFLFLLLLILFRNKKSTNLKLPPSPPKLPIIGNLHQLGTLPHRSLASLSEKHGPLMLLKLGQIQALVVSSSKMAREIMKTHDLKFCNRPKTTAPNILLYGCQDLAFSPYGEYWRQAKKICVSEFLSVKRVQSFQYVRDEEVELLVNKICKACDNGGYCVDLNRLLVSTSDNIVCRCVLGRKYKDENGKSSIKDIARRIQSLLTVFCVADFFPGLIWIDVLRGCIQELKESFKPFDIFLDKVIEEHKLANNDHECIKKDFVDILLHLQQDGMLDYHFTQDNLKAILLDMFIAGIDTTSISLEWTMAELMTYPLTMKKVQEEVRRIIGKKSKIEMNDIEKMEYMKCVIKESLRLHPPGPLLIPREIEENVKIEGYHIPSKTRVFVNAWAIQRDPEIWERPNDFIPERFMNNSVDFHGQDYEFIPFGSGRRKCPGMSFGIASFEHVLANLLYWFDWKLPDGMEMDLEEQKNGLIVAMKIPLHLKPIPYI